ncbi:MAG: hypothetical protein DWQ01_09580 [Planctomycetota bacterium]|nr:MAG: hypothetical protein DWQ01_09580 [Planctomycetota bacterium]
MSASLKTTLCAGLLLLPAFGLPAAAQSGDEVPVTIKELDVEGAIREFAEFQRQLEQHRSEVAQGQSAAVETAQMLQELRDNAGPENNYNEGAILKAIENYIDSVVVPQVELVDFLESQRYRISYYANMMARSVRPEDVALIFGTEDQNVRAIGMKVQEQAEAQEAIAAFIDNLPENQFDKQTFRPRPGMSQENRRKLTELEFRYQNLNNGMEMAKKRLALVRQAQRLTNSGATTADLDVDLILGQMFGALDRIRLQMSSDLLQFEVFLGRFAHSAQTQEIFQAFQRLVETQGGLDNPSPGLASVMDWLQESSTRHLQVGVSGLESSSGFQVRRSSDLLREAYQGARPGN